MNSKLFKFIACLMASIILTQPVYAAGEDVSLVAAVPYICCGILLLVVVLMAFKLKNTQSKIINDNLSPEDKLLVEKIKKGFENNEFKMYLQFIVDSKTKKIASAEALSRWEPANGEVVMPGRYIALMQKTGLIVNLDYYMFEMVCKKLNSWKDTEFSDYVISCNFTRITISDNNFAETIKNIAAKYDFDRSKLLIEITEDCVEKNAKIAIENITEIKKLGFMIASDDIGNGYSSLVGICGYPIDVIKLDREILLMADNDKGQKLFLGLISLAHNLELKVVCEGVETEEQNTLVSESSCDYIQGWYYFKAMPEDMAENFARDYMKNF